jgi:GAF domain-containing protein
MSDDQPLTGAMGALARTVLTGDANLQAALQRIAEAGHSMLSDCAGASLTIVEQGRPATMGATNDVALKLDESQYEFDDGPCLTAARENRQIQIDDTASDQRWPNFSAAAAEMGVSSSLSLPLPFGTEAFCGGLNLYGASGHGFTGDDVQIATAFADQAAIVVANARAYWAAFEMSKNLTIAMQSREVIDQAKGVLMATHQLTGDAAFNLLRQRSQAENRKLRDIAAEIVDAASRGDG